MRTRRRIFELITLTLILTAIGCDQNENKRLAEMSERHSERLLEQNRQMSELQREVAESSRRLVEADAQTRQQIVASRRDLQAAHGEIDRQRDLLADERRELADERRVDPIIATAIMDAALLLACLLPLVLCWYLLHHRAEPTIDPAIVEVLLKDVVSDQPVLLPKFETGRANSDRDVGASPRIANHAGSTRDTD